MREIKILSTDQSSSITGVAVFEDNILSKYDMIDLHNNKNQEERFKEMIVRISEYISAENPDYVVIEDVSLQTNVSTLLLLAQIQGAIMQVCATRNIPYYVYKPSFWRKVLKFNQGKGIKRPELKKQAKDHIYSKYGLDLKIDQCEAICIGEAFISENEKLKGKTND